MTDESAAPQFGMSPFALPPPARCVAFFHSGGIASMLSDRTNDECCGFPSPASTITFRYAFPAIDAQPRVRTVQPPPQFVDVLSVSKKAALKVLSDHCTQ